MPVFAICLFHYLVFWFVFCVFFFFFFFFQAEDGIRDLYVTGVQTCALPICQKGRLEAQVYRVEVSTVPNFASKVETRRSEEHTSELQSRRDLVCRLLLEKKNAPSYAAIDGPACRRPRGSACRAIAPPPLGPS